MSEEVEREELEFERAQEELAEVNEAETFKELLRAEAFRDFAWKLIERCAIYGEAFNTNFGSTAYTLGRQSIGKWLLVQINEADPEAWVAMQRKAALDTQKKKRSEKRKRQSH